MGYITIAEVRAEGLLIADYPDARVQAYIDTWQQVLERACRQWFEGRSLTFRWDGDNSGTAFFGVPIISVDYLRINDNTVDLETDLYKVYNASSYPDDRHNPRVALIDNRYASIYTRSYGDRLLFLIGKQNQEIKGSFGYLEGGATPLAIKRALLKLVIEKITTPIYQAPGSSTPAPGVLGPILEEQVDDHRRRYGYPGGEIDKRRPGLSGLTSDPEILDILKLYRAPIGIATPIDWR